MPGPGAAVAHPSLPAAAFPVANRPEVPAWASCSSRNATSPGLSVVWTGKSTATPCRAGPPVRPGPVRRAHPEGLGSCLAAARPGRLSGARQEERNDPEMGRHGPCRGDRSCRRPPSLCGPGPQAGRQRRLGVSHASWRLSSWRKTLTVLPRPCTGTSAGRLRRSAPPQVVHEVQGPHPWAEQLVDGSGVGSQRRADVVEAAGEAHAEEGLDRRRRPVG